MPRRNVPPARSLATVPGDPWLARQLRQAAARLLEAAAMLEATPLVNQAAEAPRMRAIFDRLPWLDALSSGALEDATVAARREVPA